MKRIAFIGAGKMATALISCIYKHNYRIIASDKNNKNLSNIKGQFKIETTSDNKEAVRNSNIVFICVKPQDIDGVLYELKGIVNNQLIVSIAAGIKLRYFESKLRGKRIIRVMPNINCMAGEMAAGFSAGKFATKDDINDVSKILGSAGISFQLKEELLDVVTAVSGSGPAFFTYFIKAFEEAGIKNGLPKEIALKIVAQTALGTEKLLIEGDISPEELIKMVASKKGTTVAGLNVLRKYKVNNIVRKTIDAAVKRSRELGK